MKILQIVALPGTEITPLVCLGEDGNVYVYRPEVFVEHGHDKAGWTRLSIPEWRE
jgi:hypothetical protein